MRPSSSFRIIFGGILVDVCEQIRTDATTEGIHFQIEYLSDPDPLWCDFQELLDSYLVIGKEPSPDLVSGLNRETQIYEAPGQIHQSVTKMFIAEASELNLKRGLFLSHELFFEHGSLRISGEAPFLAIETQYLHLNGENKIIFEIPRPTRRLSLVKNVPRVEFFVHKKIVGTGTLDFQIILI